MNTYLQSELPLIDVLVLDEADRMIEDGHFKELGFILNYIYTKRVEFKKFDKSNDKETKEISLNSEKANEIKKSILS
jgi:superfamily II DNA/RNA helicase